MLSAQREQDAESGLVHMRARQYDPKLGRFTQMDPLFRNRAIEHFIYVQNDPISRLDPLGNQGWIIQHPNGSTHDDYMRGAGEAAAKIVKMVGEPLFVVADVATTGLVRVSNAVAEQQIYAEDVSMVSGLGERLRRNVADEKSGWQNARAAAVSAFALPTGGGSVLVDNVATVFEENMTPEQASDFLWAGAGDQVLATGMVMGGSFFGGQGSTGRGGGGGKVGRQVSLREKYLGRTPGKSSRTGGEVIARMTQEGNLRTTPEGMVEVRYTDPITGVDEWVPIRGTDMSHLTDAVKYWNSEGRFLGPRHPKVREWMLDPKNYKLELSGPNRSRGATLRDRYLPPVVTEDAAAGEGKSADD